MSRVNAATSSQEHFSVEEQNPTDAKVQAVAQEKIEPPSPPEEKERPWYKKTWRFVFRPVEKGIRYVKHHPKECLIAVGTAVVVVGGLILASQSGDYPDDRPPGIIDEGLDPFAPYDDPTPPINPQPRPNYPPQQTIIDIPPPLPERSPDRGDQLMEKMQRMRDENEAKKAQTISETQNQGSTPASRQAFMEEWDRKMAEAQREINEEGNIPKNQKPSITDSAVYSKNTLESLPKEPTQIQEKISVKIENQPNMMEALNNMDGRTPEKDLMFLGFTPVMVKRSQGEPNETLQKVVDTTKEVVKDAIKGLEQAGPCSKCCFRSS